MAGSIFSEKDMRDLQAIHPAYRSVAQEIERVTNNVAFADDMISVLQSYIIDKKERDQKLFAALMTG